jgi:hypothetical protein
MNDPIIVAVLAGGINLVLGVLVGRVLMNDPIVVAVLAGGINFVLGLLVGRALWKRPSRIVVPIVEVNKGPTGETETTWLDGDDVSDNEKLRTAAQLLGVHVETGELRPLPESKPWEGSIVEPTEPQ